MKRTKENERTAHNSNNLSKRISYSEYIKNFTNSTIKKNKPV
jgi:hypothetical protein